LKITLLSSDPTHPVNSYLLKWVVENGECHNVTLVHAKRDLPGGDVLFLISCSEIINSQERSAYHKCLVLHASELPLGRGWSPHIWEILAGKKAITLTCLEAEDAVDSGKIWHQLTVPIAPHALAAEINDQIFKAEMDLITWILNRFNEIVPVEQDRSVVPTYFPKRNPEDSKLDPTRSIASQFDLLRICDPVRFPAYFELLGYKYKLTIEKIID
jgi:methionyl-tRNA formyltransferase